MIYEYLDEIDSTNDELKRRAGEVAEYTVISAGTQTGGRGRSGHVWSSPPGSSISTSMILYPRGIAAETIPRITPLAALAVADAIEEQSGILCQIKWPNDVLVGGKKVCGILNEMIPDGDGGISHVIVGIGVNVHMDSFPPEISDIATSIDLELEAAGDERQVHCEPITKSIWEYFRGYYEDFVKNGTLAAVQDIYNERLINRGRRVRIMDPVALYEGEALGIDETGALHVMTDDGERIVNSGEVSVRGTGGYV